MADDQGQLPRDNSPAADIALANQLAGKPRSEEAPKQTGVSGEPPEGDDSQREDLPEKFKGKSSKDMAKMYQELEARLGSQGKELGELRNQHNQALYGLQQYQQMLAQQQQQSRPQQSADEEDLGGKFDWDNPDKYVDKRVERKLQKALGEGLANLHRQQASSVAELAFEAARSGNPKAFEGIENDVKGMVFQGLNQGWLTPDSAMKPDTYKMAAWQIRGMRSNYNLGPNPINPVEPTSTETPSASRPTYEPPPIVFDDQAREMIKGFGEKEEDVVKLMRAQKRGR